MSSNSSLLELIQVSGYRAPWTLKKSGVAAIGRTALLIGSPGVPFLGVMVGLLTSENESAKSDNRFVQAPSLAGGCAGQLFSSCPATSGHTKAGSGILNGAAGA